MLGVAALALGLVVVVAAIARAQQDWRSASHAPVGLAPDPASAPEAVIQVYDARTVGVRGVFGVHTWIAVKPPRAKAYTVYEVIGWKLRWDDTALSVRQRAPDARWYGNAPELLADVRGAAAEALIPRIDAAARSYPYGDEYQAWPGPNSNTFTAWVLRRVPELRADLPATAIGKDYLRGRVLAAAPSGHGLQISVGGLLGITASPVEGLEVNVLGLAFGLDPWPFAVRLPLAGRFGMASFRGSGD